MVAAEAMLVRIAAEPVGGEVSRSSMSALASLASSSASRSQLWRDSHMPAFSTANSLLSRRRSRAAAEPRCRSSVTASGIPRHLSQASDARVITVFMDAYSVASSHDIETA